MKQKHFDSPTCAERSFAVGLIEKYVDDGWFAVVKAVGMQLSGGKKWGIRVLILTCYERS